MALENSPSYCFRTSYTVALQRAKKVVSDSLELVDFAVRLVNAVFNLPDGQVSDICILFFGGGGANYRRTVINPAHQILFGLGEMTFELVHAGYSLPEWQ